MNGSPSVKVALFIRNGGSESPCRWFYVTEIYNHLIFSEYDLLYCILSYIELHVTCQSCHILKSLQKYTFSLPLCTPYIILYDTVFPKIIPPFHQRKGGINLTTMFLNFQKFYQSKYLRRGSHSHVKLQCYLFYTCIRFKNIS